MMTIAAPSQAEFFGGKWSQKHFYYIKALHGYSGYADPIDNAATGWTNQTVFNMILTSSSATADTTVNVNAYGATDWIGMGVPGPSLSGTYAYATVTINASWLNTRHFNCQTPGAAACDYTADSNSERRCVASHELGHAIGLAHANVSPPLAKSIMATSHGQRCHSWGLINPQARDINDTATLY